MRQILASDPERGIAVRVEWSGGRIAVRVTYAYGTKEAPPLFISKHEMLDLMRVREVPRAPKRKSRAFPNAIRRGE